MNINVELIKYQLINSQIDTETETLEKEESNDNTLKTNFIQIYDFFAVNNIGISGILKKIPSYWLYFHLFIDYTFVKLGEIDTKYIENYKLITNRGEKHVLFRYRKEEFISFRYFISHLPCPKLYIFYIIDSYSHLLKNLLLLNNNNVCFFNISYKNIVFNTSFKPVLTNFDECLLINKLNEEDYMSKILDKIDSYTLKPLEVYVLFYLIKNNENTLSYSSIDSICDFFVENHPIVSFFSLQYKKQLFQTCCNSLKKYINESKSVIIDKIIQYSYTWDNYSLSLLYMYFVCHINKTLSLNDCFFTNFYILLNKNIHPDPLKRETLRNTIDQFNALFETFTDWSFVNGISQENYKKLLYL
jgi:hypothetical protein